ncbi:MAG TPA: transcriptional repressor [Demequina sp.]|nr:transcriptional repressor [Demequina sp.]
MTEAKPRQTKQRVAILAALGQGGFRSAQDWHDLLRHGGGAIGLATVYRALQALAESGEVDAVLTDSGETLYRLCQAREAHHHHLRCRVCGTAEDVDMPTFEAWAASVAVQHGYSRLEHTVELTGVCGRCAAEGN